MTDLIFAPYRYVAVELSVLAVLTLGFLVVFPDRPIFADVGLALLALGLLALNARYTMNVIWGQFPCTVDRRSRLQKSFMFIGPATAVAVTGLFMTGLALGYHEGGWDVAAQRVGNWRLLLALALYYPWALLQQTLFQFYLLGRLRTLFPRHAAVACTGLTYALVHLPDIGISAGAAIAGIWWSYTYDRYRALPSVAFSHALLGSTFYYWVYGEDLVKQWSDRL